MQNSKEVKPKRLKEALSFFVKTPIGFVAVAIGVSVVLFTANQYWYRPMVRRREFREAEEVADFLISREFKDFDKTSDDVQ